MLPTITLPNTKPPVWLKHKLPTTGNAWSANDQQAQNTATAPSTTPPTSNGLSALQKAVTLWGKEEYPVKQFTVAPFTVLNKCQIPHKHLALETPADEMLLCDVCKSTGLERMHWLAKQIFRPARPTT